MKAIRYILFVLLISNGLSLTAKVKTEPLSKTEWKKLTKEMSFDEDLKRNEPEEFVIEDQNQAVEKGYHGLKYVLNALVVAIIVALLIVLYVNRNINPNIKHTVLEANFLQEVETQIHEVDLAALLNEALEAEAYDIALRLSFLMIIKELSQAKLIKWAVDKTNGAYRSEMSGVVVNEEFEEIVLSFERVWYGERELNKSEFDLLKVKYDAFINRLSK